MIQQLRDYQVKAKAMIYNAFDRGVNEIIICLPTGGGKTQIFTNTAKEFIEKGLRAMVLCNRKELIGQAKKKFNLLGLYPVIIDPRYKGHKNAMCYIASVDTLRNRQLPNIDILIVDEGHIRSFDPIVLEYILKGAKIICATATPDRQGKKFLKEGTKLHEAFPEYTGQLGNIYKEIIIPTSKKELLEQGHLVEAIYYGPEVDLSDIKMKGEDYDEGSLFERFNKPKIYAGVVDNYLKHASGMKMICFCVNVEHSQKTAAEFNLRGIPAEHLDGKSKDRDAILERFKQGKTLILCNYGVTTTGYDEPTVQGIILNSATKIRSLYDQKLGRGSRPCPEIGKEYFIVIDHGSHIKRLGWWEQDIEYSLDLKYISKTIGAGPIRYCENCEAILPLSATKCTNPACNSIQLKQAEEMKLYESNFVKFDKPEFFKSTKPLYKMDIKELEAYRESNGYKLGWIIHQLLPRGREALEAYANEKGYAKAWVNRQLNMAEEKRIASKREIWEFSKKNQHISNDFLKEYAIKKLKQNHNPEEINILIPKILMKFNEIKLGVLK